VLIENPEYLVIGHGWHSRGSLDIMSYNDLATAIIDMGIIGGVFVLIYYVKLIKQFGDSRHNNHLGKRLSLFRTSCVVAVLATMLSLFTCENLTVYPSIDFVFPFLGVLSGVSWNYFKTLRGGCNAVFS
jgi:hypothetical protein